MRSLTLALLLISTAVRAEQLPEQTVTRIVNAIWVAEGGEKARVPYGVLSVKVRDSAHARSICARTVRNNWSRWEESGRRVSFIAFLGSRYCPPAADPSGHANWVSNVRKLSGVR